MKLRINTVLQPYIEFESQLTFRKNNQFYGLENDNLTKKIFSIFNDEVKEVEYVKECLYNLFSVKEVDYRIDLMREHGILTEVRESNRYTTNTNFFSLFDNVQKFNYQEIISKLNVCVLGLGGSAMILQQLAALGVKKIVGVDFDTLEHKNLNRQILAYESEVGHKKTDIIRNKLIKMNSKLELDIFEKYIESEKDVEEILYSKKIDVLILALDEPIIDSAIWVHSAAKKIGIPVLSGGVWGDMITYLYYDYRCKETACYGCSLVENFSSLQKLYLQEIRGKKFDDFNTTIAFTASIMSGILLAELVKIFTGYTDSLKSASTLQLNTTTWNMSISKIKKSSKCLICGEHNEK